MSTEQKKLGPDDDLKIIKALLIEQSQSKQNLIVTMLRKLNCEADAVKNEIEALQALEKQSYNIIFIDLSITRGNGFNLAVKIREKISGGKQPFIVALYETGEMEVGEIQTKGIDDSMKKPILLNDLRIKMNEWSQKIKSGLNKERKELIDDLILDEKFFYRVRELKIPGDESLVNTMIDLFVEDTPPILEELKKAIMNNDMQNVMTFAHNMKGIALNLGAAALANISKELELHANLNERTGLQSLFEKLGEIYRKTYDELLKHRE